MKFLPLFISLLTLLVACKTYSEDDKQSFDKQIRTYLKKKNIDCERTESGLYYKIIEKGEGKPVKYTDYVTFTYKGEFLNGDIFDNQKEPVEFEVKQLIAAWKEIMLELKPGGKAFIVAPPQLGYGDRELDDIPANSVLVYELELISVR